MALAQALVGSYPNAASGSADPHFNDVVLLMDIASNGTVSDIKNNTMTKTLGGSVVTGPFSGTNAINVTSSGYISSSTLSFSTSGAYTVEAWIRFNSLKTIRACGASNNFRNHNQFTADEWQSSTFQAGGTWYLPWFWSNGSTNYSIFPKVVSAGDWYHWFMSFDGSSKVVFGVGELGDSTGNMGRRTHATRFDNLTDNLRLHASRRSDVGDGFRTYGWRITEGVARYGDPGSDGHSTGTYTMPNAAWPTS